MKKYFTIFLILAFLLPCIGANALEFDPGYIISDNDLTDHTSMSYSEIQSFLNKKSGTLAKFSTEDKDGKTKSAAEIIFNSAYDNQVNPKFLLTMLQKEQSLIEDSSPSAKQYDWAMGYAVCDSCSMDDPRIQKFKGFGKQVDEAAGAQRWYIENAGNGIAKEAGTTYSIDGQNITMTNQATANLYTFTPHIHGNYNFWKIWHQWFTQDYPAGTLMKAYEESTVYLIEDGFRKRFANWSALISRYDPKLIVEVSKTEIDKYEDGNPIQFSNYSLLESAFGNKFLLVDNKLRKFESDEVVRRIGYNPEEFETIQVTDFKYYEKGEPINLESIYPAGALLQDNETGGVFFVQDGLKHPIPSKELMLLNYPNYHIITVSEDELAKYTLSGRAKPKDGLLLKVIDQPDVYVISEGKKWPILSGDVFESLGYKWENIQEVNWQTLTDVPLGNYITLE
jgi:hypothetical protein